MTMFIHHEPCPNCGSSDALARYEDGHTYCFSCKAYESGNMSIETYRNRLEIKEDKRSSCKLPEDFDYNIHEQGRQWLNKYSLTNKEVVENRIGWSEQGVLFKKKNIQIAPLLIFPVFDQVGHLLMWQGRNFSGSGPKYLTYGAKDVLHILGDSNTIVVTEDLISAIKCSRVTSAMPLWGSFMSLETAKRLSERFTKCFIWLDKDKAQEAFKQAQNYSHLFKEGCFSIRTERDPKEYNTQEIKENLK